MEYGRTRFLVFSLPPVVVWCVCLQPALASAACGCTDRTDYRWFILHSPKINHFRNNFKLVKKGLSAGRYPLPVPFSCCT